MSVAREANERNNAAHQELRLTRWASVRDHVWALLDAHLTPAARVCIVGAGSCDDVPLTRIAERAAAVDLVDFDVQATDRALARLPNAARSQLTVIECDVTSGCADVVLQAARAGTPLPDSLPLPYDALGAGNYDLVIGDMLYTQLLHAGMLALDLPRDAQRRLMARYDPPLTNALVHRLHASAGPGGRIVHIHDLACWASDHAQPCNVDDVLTDPDTRWRDLRRHDACDPHLVLERLRANILETAWWEWPFEPNKRFVVRASVARAGVGAGTPFHALF